MPRRSPRLAPRLAAYYARAARRELVLAALRAALEIMRANQQ